MKVPEVRYAHTERGAVAYQVFGRGEVPIVILLSWVQCLDAVWDAAVDLRRWEFFASLGQVVLLDRRGLGSSDPLPLDRVGDLDETTFDVLSVMDEIGMTSATLVGDANSSYGAVHLAAACPARIDRLVLFNPRRGGNFTTREESAEDLVSRTRLTWGTTESGVGANARFRMNFDPEFVARFQRLAAPPGVAAAMVASTGRINVEHLLGQLKMPTLVIHTGDLVGLACEESAAVAEAIPNARFVQGESTSWYWGPWADELASFVTGQPALQGDRDIAALAFTDVVGSTELAGRVGDLEWKRTLEFHDAYVERQVAKAGGQVVKQTGDGHLLAFPRPGAALDAVSEIVRHAPGLGVHLRAGVHFAEVERRPNGDLGGLGVHVCARVCALAGPDEVLVTRTVTDMAAGGGWTFADRGSYQLKGVPGDWQVLALGVRTRGAEAADQGHPVETAISATGTS